MCWRRRPSWRRRSTSRRRGCGCRSCRAAPARTTTTSPRARSRRRSPGSTWPASRGAAAVAYHRPMDRLLVTGGARLAGAVRVSGAKNSALKLMAASLLAPGRSVVRNVPRIRDCEVMAELLRHVGVEVTLSDGVATLDATSVDDVEAPNELAGRIRASIVVLGPLLAR